MANAPKPSRRAFSLIELLVAIGLIAVLIALLIPALAAARRAASDTVVLARLRDTGLTFAAYIDAHDSTHPWAPLGAMLDIVPPGDPTQGRVSCDVWNLTGYWPTLFHTLAPWTEHFESSWIAPDSPGRTTAKPWQRTDDFDIFAAQPSWAYARAFLADPAMWSGHADRDRYAYTRPVRAHEIRFPSSKALLYDHELPFRVPRTADTDTRAILFPDGHAAEHQLSHAKPPVPDTPDGPGRPLHDTPDGVRGRDF